MTQRGHAVFTDRAEHDPSHSGVSVHDTNHHAAVPPVPRGTHAGHHAPSEPPERSRAFTIASIAICLIAILGAVLWSFASARLQAKANERAIAEIRTGIVVGMSRAAAYAWLRDHELVAVNPAYAAWTKNRMGVWFRSDDGAWPQPNEQRPVQPASRPLNPEHPEVNVKLDAAPPGGCGMATIEQILFDRFDRVKHIAYSAPYWTCQ